MQIFVDTGVWLRAFDTSSPERSAIVDSLRTMIAKRIGIATAAQNIAEFWNVSTRPRAARGRFGLPTSAVEMRVQWIERIALVLPFTVNDYREWRALVVHHQITGVSVHDSRLVAVMMANQILTLNTADFRRYSGISAVTPSEFLLAEKPT